MTISQHPLTSHWESHLNFVGPDFGGFLETKKYLYFVYFCICIFTAYITVMGVKPAA